MQNGKDYFEDPSQFNTVRLANSSRIPQEY